MKFRGHVKTTYSDGTVEIFDPLIRWRFDVIGGEIGLRGDYSIGWLWKYRIGTYSCYRTRWIEFANLTFYVHLGMCDPHNPRTGKSYA